MLKFPIQRCFVGIPRAKSFIPTKNFNYTSITFPTNSLSGGTEHRKIEAEYGKISNGSSISFRTTIMCNGTNWLLPIPRNYHTRTTRQPKRSYYDILKLPISCSKKEIKAQFYKLSLKHHPDLIKHSTRSKQQIHNDFLEITEAYKTLSDESLRREYDRKHRFSTPQNRFSSHSGFNKQTGTYSNYNLYNQPQTYRNPDFYKTSNAKQPGGSGNASNFHQTKKPFQNDKSGRYSYDFEENVRSRFFRSNDPNFGYKKNYEEAFKSNRENERASKSNPPGYNQSPKPKYTKFSDSSFAFSNNAQKAYIKQGHFREAMDMYVHCFVTFCVVGVVTFLCFGLAKVI